MKRFAGLRSALPWILGLVLFAGMIVWLVTGLSTLPALPRRSGWLR